MKASQGLARVTIVLNEPQDPVNIGSVVRAMKNMGLDRLHLVRPADFDAYRIEGVAHTGLDIIESTACFDDLRSAIAHCNLVIGTTARGRRVQRSYLKPRQAAQEILATTGAGGEAALVFGREDRGLHNADLDLCARIAVIPTEPDHSSINLAQAVMILAYELFTTSAGETPFKKPRLESLAASCEELPRRIGQPPHAADLIGGQQRAQPANSAGVQLVALEADALPLLLRVHESLHPRLPLLLVHLLGLGPRKVPE